VEMALQIGGLDFAAGQRHRLENPFVAECGILILLFRLGGPLTRILLVSIPTLFSHKE